VIQPVSNLITVKAGDTARN